MWLPRVSNIKLRNLKYQGKQTNETVNVSFNFVSPPVLLKHLSVETLVLSYLFKLLAPIHGMRQKT